MSVLPPLTHPGPGAGGGTVDVLPADSPRKPRVPLALAIGLLLLLLYAAFSHGATGLGTGTRIQVALAAVVVAVGAAGWWRRRARFAAAPLALTGILLLIAFAVWCGVTLIWSVAPDQTWIELNRALSYVIVLCLAVVVGASEPRAVAVIAKGYLLVVLAVTLYAIGQKVLPGLHIAGVFDLNQTGPLPRLQEPFGYWNALALFIVLGVPAALVLAVDVQRTRSSRLAALLALDLMLLAIAFSYSRGGLIALVVVLAVVIALNGTALRSLMWLTAALLALLPSLIFGLSSHSLTAADVSLSSRETAGLTLLGVLLVSLLTLAIAARTLYELEVRVRLKPHQTARIRRILIGTAAALLVVGIIAVAVSSRGLSGTVSHAWKSFTQTRATSVYEPTRLLSADSENRWVWWKEAAGAFSARPVTGWGAGSFPVVHLLYRRDTLSVSQPHSVPLQFLAETGVIGTALAMGGLMLLLLSAVRFARQLPPGPERLLAAALLGGAVGYAVHALYDWDWNIPGVTMPAFVFLGVLAGAAARRPPAGTSGTRLRTIARVFGFVALALYVCAFAASALLPDVAASKASEAIVAAANPSPSGLQRAEDAAKLASRLDPLSDAGLKVQATIAIRRRQLRRAQADLIEATKREPTDGGAWQQLAGVEIALGDSSAGIEAVNRVLALDPRGMVAHAFAANIVQGLDVIGAPPAKSATAVPTPGS